MSSLLNSINNNSYDGNQLTYLGETKTFAEWAKLDGVEVVAQTIKARLDRGWSIEDSLFRSSLNPFKRRLRAKLKKWCVPPSSDEVICKEETIKLLKAEASEWHDGYGSKFDLTCRSEKCIS